MVRVMIWYAESMLIGHVTMWRAHGGKWCKRQGDKMPLLFSVISLREHTDIQSDCGYNAQ